MHVHMLPDPRAGRFPEVEPHINPLGTAELAQRTTGKLNQRHHFRAFFGVKFGDVRHMPQGNNHQMPRRVRVTVEHHEQPAAAPDDKAPAILRIPFRPGGHFGKAERAIAGFGSENVLDTPGSPYVLCHPHPFSKSMQLRFPRTSDRCKANADGISSPNMTGGEAASSRRSASVFF